MSTDKNTLYKTEIIRARTEFVDLVSSLNEEQLQTPVISEGLTWNVLDIVAHILENERAMSIHVHKIRQGRETVPENFDLEKWNAGLKERMEPRPLEDMLTDLEQARVKTLEVLASIKEEEWDLQGHHPLRSRITIEQYYETIAGHDSWHARDIRKALGLE